MAALPVDSPRSFCSTCPSYRSSSSCFTMILSPTSTSLTQSMRTCGVDRRYGRARWCQEGPGDDQSKRRNGEPLDTETPPVQGPGEPEGMGTLLPPRLPGLPWDSQEDWWRAAPWADWPPPSGDLGTCGNSAGGNDDVHHGICRRADQMRKHQ